MKVDSPASARRSFSAVKSLSDMYTSPRTSSSAGASSTRSGIAPIVRRLCVTSSPISPLPRVAPRSSTPFRYRRLIARPSILGSHHERELGIGDALARKVVAHPLDPRAQLLLGAHVAERQHRLEVSHLLETPHRLATHPLRRRVGRDELRVLALDRPQLVEQPVVGVVADLGVVEDVVAVGVMLELRAQLLRPGSDLCVAEGWVGGAHGCASWATGASISSRSKRRSASRLGRSVRSKWIGVTAMRPAATAARSVPGSS